MSDSLFDVAFRGYTAPLEAQKLQADTALEKTRNQAAQTELHNQAALQSGLAQVWGSGGEFAAAGSILKAQGLGGAGQAQDPNDDKRLQATAALMYKTGNVADGTALLNMLSLNKTRQATAQRAALSASATGLRMVGSAIGAVTDQPSYNAVLSDLQEQGVNLGNLNLTGDFDTDRPTITSLANASLTQAQRLSAQDRQTKEADVNGYRNTRLTQLGQGLGYQAQRLQQNQQRINDSETAQQHKVEEDNKRDARAQAGLENKQVQSAEKSAAKAVRVTPTEAAATNEIFNSDEATSVIPQHLRQVYAKEASQRAKQIIASDLATKPAGTSYSPEDYDKALRQAIAEQREQGRFSPNRSAGLWGSGVGATETYQYQPPKGNAPSPAQRPAAAVKPKTPVYGSAADVTAAYKAGALTREQAKAILVQRGWAAQ